MNDSGKIRRKLRQGDPGKGSLRLDLSRWGIAAAILGVIFCICRVPGISAQSPEPGEYAVKAAFLFHFAQFVEWPEGAFREASSPLVYCTIGPDPFQGALEASFKGKVIGTHALQVRHLQEASEAQGCHVVFIGKVTKRRLLEELASLEGNPVLTVGETEQFVKENGIISFCMEENKIRFDINLESAERVNLKISARLLTLAKTVIGKPRRD